MERKIENRNIDVTKARGELEEDLLEYVYRMWRQGRQITSKEYAREVNITGYEAAGLVRSLVKKGFLCEPENGHLELTDKGKLEGMECLARHEKLTQFFQMVSGMDQQRAQEDACRVEHYISPEGLKGIENFCSTVTYTTEFMTIWTCIPFMRMVSSRWHSDCMNRNDAIQDSLHQSTGNWNILLY